MTIAPSDHQDKLIIDVEEEPTSKLINTASIFPKIFSRANRSLLDNGSYMITEERLTNKSHLTPYGAKISKNGVKIATGLFSMQK